MCDTLLAAFTARTTRVSNPDRSPSFHPSPSDPCWYDAFAIGGPPRIRTFYRSPQHTSYLSRSLVWQCFLHVVQLSWTISQKIYQTGYGCFRPNNNGPHLWRWCYRGCWHQSCPPLILRAIYTRQKPMQCMSTQSSLITLACIVKFSRLLYSVESGPLSQCPPRGYLSQGPY